MAMAPVSDQADNKGREDERLLAAMAALLERVEPLKSAPTKAPTRWVACEKNKMAPNSVY